jgi:hypothetical protein
MTRIITIVALAAATAVVALPAGAVANQVDRVAKQECKQEAASEPGEFAAEYGGTGRAAVKKCARREKREAIRDCKADRATEPNEFATEYGGMGDGAMRRCTIDELR